MSIRLGLFDCGKLTMHLRVLPITSDFFVALTLAKNCANIRVRLGYPHSVYVQKIGFAFLKCTARMPVC